MKRCYSVYSEGLRSWERSFQKRNNEYISEQVSYVFHCGNIRCCNHEWDITNAERLYREIMENAGEGVLWKNIPLVRDFIHELKDNAPFRNYQENPAGKAP